MAAKQRGYPRPVAGLIYSLLAAALSATVASAKPLAVPAPDCLGATLGGQDRLTLESLRGKVVYVDFWASWCPPCRHSFPVMQRLYDEFSVSGFEIVAVNLDQEVSQARRFLATNPVAFSVTHDNSGACPQAFGVQAMPTSYLIDKDGTVRWRHSGFRRGEEGRLKQIIRTLIEDS